MTLFLDAIICNHEQTKRRSASLALINKTFNEYVKGKGRIWNYCFEKEIKLKFKTVFLFEQYFQISRCCAFPEMISNQTIFEISHQIMRLVVACLLVCIAYVIIDKSGVT